MTANSKTFIILSPGFPANECDTTCMPFPQLFVKTLKQLNPSLEIIVLAFQYPFVKSVYNWHGVKVIAFGGRSKGKLYRLLIWKAVWKKLKAIVKQHHVIGVLSFWLGECGLIGKYAGTRYNIKSFTWLLGQDARRNNQYYSLIKPTSKSLVALSDAIADEFYRNYKIVPSHIIPPGIDAKIILPARNLRDIDILGAGSLIPLKQFDIFILVISKIVNLHPKIRTIICGGGPEKDRLQKKIREANLSGNIELVGELEHKAVIDLMRRTKIFLHPSSYEGFATVYPEALFAGAHVVGFCEPMKTGFKNLHIVKTDYQMAETINELLNDKDLSHESVVTGSIEKTCNKIMQLYGM